MTAYYNENEPHCIEWLKNLIAEKLIAPGVVDNRDIQDVRPIDLRGFAQCHFFAGIGGWSYALRLAGCPDDRPVWTGSCPCQPFSAAGKRLGFADDRHLWPYWRYLVAVERPSVVFGEQVASAAAWLSLVRGDLEALGYAVGAIPIEAASAGADHLRDRFWFVADDGARRRDGARDREAQLARGTEAERASPVADSSSTGLALGAGDGRVHGEQAGASEGQAAVSGSVVGNGTQQPKREQDHQGDADADARQARSISGGAGHNYAVANTLGDRCRDWSGLPAQRQQNLPSDSGPSRSGEFSWVIGADGKARRVKPGVRLLAHDVPARVAKLRAFGNAIVPQVAAQFIRAALECG